MNHDARATRTSGGRGGGNCWEMKSGPLCAWVRLSGDYNRPRNACSTWRLDSDDVAPRAVASPNGTKTGCHAVVRRPISSTEGRTEEIRRPQIRASAEDPVRRVGNYPLVFFLPHCLVNS